MTVRSNTGYYNVMGSKKYRTPLIPLKDFDIVAEARSPCVGIVKKFAGLRAAEFITITLTPVAPETETIICGIEIRAEDKEWN